MIPLMTLAAAAAIMEETALEPPTGYTGYSRAGTQYDTVRSHPSLNSPTHNKSVKDTTLSLRGHLRDTTTTKTQWPHPGQKTRGRKTNLWAFHGISGSYSLVAKSQSRRNTPDEQGNLKQTIDHGKINRAVLGGIQANIRCVPRSSTG